MRRHITVYYSTQNRNSERISGIIYQTLLSAGFTTARFNLANIKPSICTTLDTAIFVVPTYSMNKPNPEARPFFSWLEGLNVQDKPFENVKFAVFGLGSSHYRKAFNTAAIWLNERLGALGGVRIIDPLLADQRSPQGYEKYVQEWIPNFIRSRLDISEQKTEVVDIENLFNSERFNTVLNSTVEDAVSFWDPLNIPNEEQGYVHNHESSAVDGGGWRDMFFLQGCRLRCKYCCNPDTLVMGDPELHGEKIWTADKLVDKVYRNRFYTKNRQGAITMSGGDPLCQPRFVHSILRQCKEKGINTALEITGDVPDPRVFDIVMPHLDTALICVKSFNPAMYAELTQGGSYAAFLQAMHQCQKHNVDVWITYVLIENYTDSEDDLKLFCDFLDGEYKDVVKRVEILPYHDFGLHKYEEMGMEYPFPGEKAPEVDVIRAFKQKLAEHHNEVVV
ncbi:hypothetical protein PCE1_002441 [Barthelona sp. PCE]